MTPAAALGWRPVSLSPGGGERLFLSFSDALLPMKPSRADPKRSAADGRGTADTLVTLVTVALKELVRYGSWAKAPQIVPATSADVSIWCGGMTLK